MKELLDAILDAAKSAGGELGYRAGAIKSDVATYFDVVTKTAAYTITTDNRVILCDATSAAFTVTLPTAVGIEGREFTIVKTDSSVNAVTVDGNGSETINGATTKALSSQWDKVTVVSDGSNWVIVG